MTKTVAKNHHDSLQNKLILGASSWGNDYGVSNRRGIKLGEISVILKLANAAGISQIDTSPEYGDSEILIGRGSRVDLDIYSKVSAASWAKGRQGASIAIQESIRRLGTERLAGLMFHSSKSLLESPKESSLFMEEAVSSGLAKAWGVSVYEPTELEEVLSVCKPDFIQLPNSLADRRFQHSGLISKLFAESIEVHTRSIFLQGLILQDPSFLSGKFKEMSSWAIELENFSRDCGLSKFQLALLFNLTNTQVSKVLVGVNAAGHLKEMLENLKEPLTAPDFGRLGALDSTEIIDPRRWKI